MKWTARKKRVLCKKVVRPLLNSGSPVENQPNKNSMPRWLAIIYALIAWVVGVPLVHGVVPWLISSLSPRFGWTEGRPGTWNQLGLIPVLIGAILLIWVFILHISQTPERVELARTPSYLIVRGPYRFTRNPMYVAELSLWLGWVIFYGSIAVLIAFLLVGLVMDHRVTPREERDLEDHFGEAYLQYKRKVPRWLGKL